MKTQGFFSYALCCLLFVLSSTALFADHIRMKDGRILYGKILHITRNSYILQKTDDSRESVPKSKIINVYFTGLQHDPGYTDYFARLYWGLGRATYSEEGVDEINKAGRPWSEGGPSSSYGIPARVGLDAGWMITIGTLAARGGLEYNQSKIYKENDLDYSYLSLTAGLSLHFNFNLLGLKLYNCYLQPQIRLPFQGSVRSSSQDLEFRTHTIKLEKAPLERDGLGYGLILAKEWRRSYFTWGLGLSYSIDKFQVDRSDTISALKAIPATVQYYGIHLSISYD